MIIPWNQLEDYIDLHQKCIQNLVQSVQEEIMTKDIAQTCLPKSFKKLYERINKILKDNSEPQDVSAEAYHGLKKLDESTKQNEQNDKIMELSQQISALNVTIEQYQAKIIELQSIINQLNTKNIEFEQKMASQTVQLQQKIKNMQTKLDKQKKIQAHIKQDMVQNSKSELPKVQQLVPKDDIERILQASVACTKREEIIFLRKILGNRAFKTTMLYRGSRDGFTGQAFHDRCDKKGPTISLFKLRHNGDCIGGFTEAQWEGDDISKRDPCALVFSLSHQRSYKVIKPEKAIACYEDWGPCFGSAICVYSEPFNGYNECYSVYNQHEYELIGVSGEVCDLTQTSTKVCGGYVFSISELEVWEVGFK